MSVFRFRRHDRAGAPGTPVPAGAPPTAGRHRAGASAERPRTRNERAEAIIGEIVAGDVAQGKQLMQDRRAALALQRRFRPRNQAATMRLEAALDAARRRLAELQDRQDAWSRDRAFERDLVERVLLMARITDSRDAAARALRRTRTAVTDLPAVGSHWPTVAWDLAADENPDGTTLAAVLDYLRTHHPPVADG